MANQAIEVLIEGRLVGGHPMEQFGKTDDRGVPKMQADGVSQVMETYIGIAIPKGTETDWKQTPWGQQFQSAAIRDWPAGEHASITFAWKVIDGDSQIPNKKGNKPCDREGYPGHWIVGASTQWAIKCYHVGKYDPMQQIQDKNEIKCGDYCRVSLNVKGNGPCQSPGIYVNPTLFELNRAGVQIITSTGPSAADVFGGGVSAGQSATPIAQPGQGASLPPGSVAPAPDFLQPPGDFSVNVNGQVCLASALKTSGWTDEQIAGMPRVLI